MALPPKFAGQAISSSGHSAQHTIELFLDYVCPFSAKMFKTFSSSIFPLLASTPKYKNVRFIFRQQIQPWHPSSTLVHEAGVAVLKVAPEKFIDFSAKLFEEQKAYFDLNVLDEVRNETYKRLAKVAGSVGVDEHKVLELLVLKPSEDPESLNVGNGVTNDLKVLVKMNRLQGVHVTPTVLFDGVEERSISSGWTADQWKEWLDKSVA